MVNLEFLSYSEYEAASIITTITDELENKKIRFDAKSLKVKSPDDTQNREPIRMYGGTSIGFKPNE